MIDYKILADAIEYYKRMGYVEINMPWYVKDNIHNITFETNKSKWKLPSGDILLGSAEQGFINQMLNHNLLGKFQATTPCFREDSIDELHQEHFIKTELFINESEDFNKTLDKTLSDVFGFLIKYVDIARINFVDTSSETGTRSIDIEIDGIEVGSYGIREYKYRDKSYTWVYGTGIALPRFSGVLI